MKLLCKKSYTTPFSAAMSGIVLTLPGIYYSFRVLDTMPSWLIFCDGVNTCVFRTKLSDFSDSNIPHIWNYFYTPQEERKIKLEKIDNLV